VGFWIVVYRLGFMKDAMELQVQTFDFAQYASMPSIFFLGIGFVITLLVQSSSVTMALTLSALHFGAIDFASAAAIVLGSETGTTIKIMLSAIGGNARRKKSGIRQFYF
ncbi:MAG: Na/Pi cotransporter family protein, partial [Bacteroidetes bacterium]|nr:Na/Pi cotransporter family protein [Bacteroidota bacterium]